MKKMSGQLARMKAYKKTTKKESWETKELGFFLEFITWQHYKPLTSRWW